jgi:prolyl 4-hydroxylase
MGKTIKSPNITKSQKNNKSNEIYIEPYEYVFLDNIFLPNSIKLNSTKINLYTVENFIDKQTCEIMIDIIKKNNVPSTVTGGNKRDKYDSNVRTSNTCFMDQTNKAVINLEKKISNYIGIEKARSETSQGQYYKVGNEFKQHTDWFTRNTNEWDIHASKQGQRTWTFMIYLNEVEQGGETEFIKLGTSIKPKQGMAVLWNNLYKNGQENGDTEHAGRPIINGEKFIITKWFRTRGTLNYPYNPKENI